MPASQPLKRILLTISPELLQVLDISREFEERNPYIEELLWSHPVVCRCAEAAEIQRMPRRREGRLFASEIEDSLSFPVSSELHT